MMWRTLRHAESVSRSAAHALSRIGCPWSDSSQPTGPGLPMKRLIQAGVIALAPVPGVARGSLFGKPCEHYREARNAFNAPVDDAASLASNSPSGGEGMTTARAGAGGCVHRCDRRCR